MAVRGTKYKSLGYNEEKKENGNKIQTNGVAVWEIFVLCTNEYAN